MVNLFCCVFHIFVCKLKTAAKLQKKIEMRNREMQKLFYCQENGSFFVLLSSFLTEMKFVVKKYTHSASIFPHAICG